MPMTAKEALRRLLKDGWIIVRQTGSHIQLYKEGQRVTLPMHSGDLTPGVEKDIKKKAGW